MILLWVVGILILGILMLPGDKTFAKCRFNSDGRSHNMEDVECTYMCDGPLNEAGDDNIQVEATFTQGRCKNCGAYEEDLDW